MSGPTSMPRGWIHAAVHAGILAGIIGTAVLILVRIDLSLVGYAIVSLLTGSWSADPSRRALSETWTALKIAAYPFVGPRSLRPGFDARIVLLGIVTHLAFSIGSGALFGLMAHGRSPGATVAVGVVFGVALWAANSYFIFPPVLESVRTVIEFFPYGLAMAIAFLWYQRRFPPPHHHGQRH